MKHYGANKTLDIPAYADLSKVMKILDLYDSRTRKICNRLILLQQKWIDNEGLQGIQRCKQLLLLWSKWLASGFNTEAIPPYRFKHSLMSKLQHAMRLAAYSKKQLEISNLISTVLRLHQSYGASDSDIAEITEDEFNSITQSCNLRALAFGLYDRRYLTWEGHGLSSEAECYAYGNAWIVQQFLRTFLSPGTEQYNYIVKSEPFKSMRSIQIRIERESMEPLTKAGPHNLRKRNGNIIALKSIISEALDAHAFDATPTAFKQYVTVSEEGHASLRSKSPSDRNLHNIIDDMNEFILSAPHRGEIGLTYAPCKAEGQLPSWLQANVGRIVVIKDKAGKKRFIAMTSYSVNKTLSPIHRWLFNLLDKLPCDSTKQSRGIQELIKSTAEKLPLESLDLSDATNRLPLIVQRKVLEHFLLLCAGYDTSDAKRLSHLWHELLSSLTFVMPDGRTVRYGAGTPMGVYTSWPSLSLTNHVCAWIAKAWSISTRESINFDEFGKTELRELIKFIQSGYLVCGDDIVIKDSLAGVFYHNLMEGLGVKINKTKGYSSKRNAPVSVAEFCKKLAINGNLYSGQSLKVILRCMGIDNNYKVEPMLIPSAIRLLKALKAGHTLSQRTLRVIANSYPRKLHHIPLEFGGLGIPKHGSTCCQCLAENGFIVFYYYNKVQSMLRIFSRSDLSTGEPLADSTLPGQLKYVDKLSQYSSLPDNLYREYDSDYRQLFNRDWFRDTSVNHNMEDRLRAIRYDLDQMIQTGIPIEYCDWVDLVDTITEARTSFIKTRQTFSTSHWDNEVPHADIISARTALKSVKQCSKSTNLLRFDAPGSETQRCVLVNFAEYALYAAVESED